MATKCFHALSHLQPSHRIVNDHDFIHGGKKLLSDLSTWRIGGPCKSFIQATDQRRLISAIRHCNEQSMKYIVIGKGSNCLFDDSGFDGCVIVNSIKFLEKIGPGLYRAGSGYPVNLLGVQTAEEGFGGLEFAGGVPGTVGGAVYMNAGANGQETGNAVECVEIVTMEGDHEVLNRNDLEFGYRKSSFQDMPELGAISAVTFRLNPSQTAKKMQQQYLQRRKLTQPVGERTAGSVFRNPAGSGLSAAQLIEKAGLKGYRLGDALISDKHANFFINCGRASSRDMLDLICRAKETVYQQFGVKLKEEIFYVHPH